MTAEEIYPLIADDPLQQTLDTHAYDRDPQAQGHDSRLREDRLSDPARGRRQEQEADAKGGQGSAREHRSDASPVPGDSGSEAPPPLAPDERETLAIQWRQRLAGAAQQAKQAGKLGGGLARLVDHLLQPQLPWRMLLARYLTALARDDYSYMRPSRREGPFILPSLRSHQVELAVGLDTSGSIKQEEVGEFLAEVQALKGQLRARVTLLACDAALTAGGPWVFEPWETFKYPDRLQGGGGTDFRPVFDWLLRQDRSPDVLIYFTDADGTFPQAAPGFPVIWLIKGRHPVPWGQRIQLN